MAFFFNALCAVLNLFGLGFALWEHSPLWLTNFSATLGWMLAAMYAYDQLETTKC